jgi:hypothetical protein
MLSLVQRSGVCSAFSLSHLYRISFDGHAEIRLHFSDDIVHIQGQRLQPLYRRLIDQSADEIVEFDPLHASATNATFAVTSIQISPCEN